MKRYWFYGSMPKDTVLETELTDKQKQIIELENNKIDTNNYINSWLGYKKTSGWDFVRHGLEVIHVSEERGNIARKTFEDIIFEKYVQDL